MGSNYKDLDSWNVALGYVISFGYRVEDLSMI